MKTNFFILLICYYFLAISNASAQNVEFKFEIWKNTVSAATYLGVYTANTSSTNLRDLTTGLTSSLDPGDELIIKNRCSFNGSQLSFDGTTKKATIGLTEKTACSIVGPPANPNHLKHIADVCQGPSPGSISGCTTAPQHFNTWNWGSNITITIPPYTSSTGNMYLMFSYGITGSPVSSCGCWHRYSFTSVNITPTVVNPPILNYAYLARNEVYVHSPIQTGPFTVINEYTGATVQTSPYRNGIKLAYTTDVKYVIMLESEEGLYSELFIIPGTCDQNRSYNPSNNTSFNFEPTTLNAFPNPTTGLVNVQLKNAKTAETNIQVLNVLGQVILEKQVKNDNNIEIDLSKAINGIYMLHIVNGDTEFTEKVIKE